MGCLSSAYLTALSSGKPLEWKEIRQSHIGHWSTLSCRMVSSSKMFTVMYSKRSSRSRISCMGLDRDFLAMAQTPTTTCDTGSMSSKLSPWNRYQELFHWKIHHELSHWNRIFNTIPGTQKNYSAETYFIKTIPWTQCQNSFPETQVIHVITLNSKSKLFRWNFLHHSLYHRIILYHPPCNTQSKLSSWNSQH